MTQTINRSITYEEYLALPDDGNRYEIIEGELYMTPPPVAGHQYASGELFFALKTFLGKEKRGVIYYPPFEVHLPSSANRNVFQPDLTFIRTENKPKASATFFAGVPDLVVEILSKSTRTVDLTTKYQAYEAGGIPEYWIVDPKGKTVTVHSLVEGKYDVHGEYAQDELITSPLLVGLEIINSSLFDTDD